MLRAVALTLFAAGLARGATVGIVAPLSGEYSPYGESFVRGVRLAANRFALEIDVRDSRSDPVTAVMAVRDLATTSEIVAVVGPMLSRAALASAVLANAVRLPVILPVALVEGLERVGPWCFQVNGTLPALGRMLARHAVREEGLRRLAVLYPRTVYGTVLTRGFVAEAEAMGAEVAAVVSYDEGQTDFGEELKAVMEARAEALFLPGTTRELVQIVPQVAFWQIECRLVGAYGWDSPRLTQVVGEIANGALVAVVIGGEVSGRELERAFQEEYRGEPDRYTQVGWDALHGVAEAIVGRRDPSREAVRRELREQGWQPGASGGLLWSGLGGEEGVEIRVFYEGNLVTPEEFAEIAAALEAEEEGP